MDFINETSLIAGWTLGFEADGRELLVVAIKGTFVIPEEGEEAFLAEEQVPLTEADEFTGEPGLSAILHESDFAHHKICCDVLLNGSAYAPGATARDRVQVAVQVARMRKSFNVVGDRHWDTFLGKPITTLPVPFVIKKISYDFAYGGVDSDPKDPGTVKSYLENPVGVGYYPMSSGSRLQGKRLPNTEEVGKEISGTAGDYAPMSFGAIGRNFLSRYPFAGTYDDQWLTTRAPFWPDDFDYRYFQAAPVDQQVPYPTGGEVVTLGNLSPQGRLSFRLPPKRMPVLFLPYRGAERQLEGVIDTMVIEPDLNRIMLTWRVSLRLRKDCFDLREVIVGEIPEESYYRRRAEASGRPYFRSISEFIRMKKESL